MKKLAITDSPHTIYTVPCDADTIAYTYPELWKPALNCSDVPLCYPESKPGYPDSLTGCVIKH